VSSLSDHRALNSTLRKRCFCWRTLETLFHTKPQPFHFDALFLGTESPSIATTHRLGTSHHWNAVAAPIFAQFLELGPEISWNYHTERPRIFGCLFFTSLGSDRSSNWWRGPESLFYAPSRTVVATLPHFTSSKSSKPSNQMNFNGRPPGLDRGREVKYLSRFQSLNFIALPQCTILPNLPEFMEVVKFYFFDGTGQ